MRIAITFAVVCFGCVDEELLEDHLGEPDVSTTTSDLAQNYEYSGQPDLAQIGITSALHDQVSGAGIGIANVDGYPDLGHADLYTNVMAISLYGAPRLPFRWSTDHSTHVIGTMNGIRNGQGIVGVAPGAYTYDFPIWSSTDTSLWAVSTRPRVYDYIRSLNVQGKRVVVLNREINSARYQDGAYHFEAVFADGDLPQLANYRTDFVVVQPVGNQGQVIFNQRYEPRAATNLSHLLLVGSVDASNTVSSFSNRPAERCFYRASDTVCVEAEKLKQFFVVAPGRSIRSSVSGGGTAQWTGTSMAAPHVSGLVALLAAQAKAAGRTRTPTQLVQIIKQSAKDLGPPGVDAEFGWGLIDVPAALALERTMP